MQEFFEVWADAGYLKGLMDWLHNYATGFSIYDHAGSSAGRGLTHWLAERLPHGCVLTSLYSLLS